MIIINLVKRKVTIGDFLKELNLISYQTLLICEKYDNLNSSETIALYSNGIFNPRFGDIFEYNDFRIQNKLKIIGFMHITYGGVDKYGYIPLHEIDVYKSV